MGIPYNCIHLGFIVAILAGCYKRSYLEQIFPSFTLIDIIDLIIQ